MPARFLHHGTCAGLAALLALGCRPAATTRKVTDPSQAAAPAEPEKDRPLHTWKQREQLYFRSSVRCTTGPMEVSIRLPPVEWGASVVLTAITSTHRALPVQYEVHAGGIQRKAVQYGTGAGEHDEQNSHCHPDAPIRLTGPATPVPMTVTVPEDRPPARPAGRKVRKPPPPAPTPTPVKEEPAPLVPVVATGQIPSLPGNRTFWKRGNIWFAAQPEFHRRLFPDLTSKPRWACAPPTSAIRSDGTACFCSPPSPRSC